MMIINLIFSGQPSQDEEQGKLRPDPSSDSSHDRRTGRRRCRGLTTFISGGMKLLKILLEGQLIDKLFDIIFDVDF